ncbi:TNF receptor-associated factor 6 [Orchesella cincta]|uniref:TNF receptor-associated factor 6 n=1 Tax=Orchesella cincta TaxID=48709 RepID=A0A1D2NGN3_ORCCI|nr:TNF receptor-associated factor 6 [Orchesella cincta]
MSTSCFITVTFGFLCYFTLCLSQVTVQQTRSQANPSQWFDETIDEFLRNAQDTGEATDIQVSTCKISSRQLVATAQATAARVLKGVCNPAEIEDRFHNLETQLGDQLNVLKAMLLSLEEKLVEQDHEIKRNQRRVMSVLSGIRRNDGASGSTVIDDSNTYSPAYVPATPHRAEEVVGDDEDVQNTLTVRGRLNEDGGGAGVGSSLGGSGAVAADTTSLKSGHVGPRSSELMKYNSTVHIENGKRVFSYYWVVTGMAYKLNNWNQHRVLRSNSFYIYPRGYRMYVKIIPKYSSTTMFLHVGITKGEHDETLDWPFSFKMRIHVLDQDESKGRVQDLKSRMWDPKELCSGSNWQKPVVGDNPECVGLGIPHDVIKTGEYIWNDRIVIKLNVYLD